MRCEERGERESSSQQEPFPFITLLISAPASCSSSDHRERGRERREETSHSSLPSSLVLVFLPHSSVLSLSPSLLFPTQHRTTPLVLFLSPSLSLSHQSNQSQGQRLRERGRK